MKRALKVLAASLLATSALLIIPTPGRAQWDEYDNNDSDLEELYTSRADRSIRGTDPKNLPFDRILKSSGKDGITNILYDRAVEGDMCFISCNNYNGVTSKWSNFYVEIQPFENFCMALTGCSSQYPLPPQTVTLNVSGKQFKLDQIDSSLLRYYLPLEARAEIAKNKGGISIDIAGVKMPRYKIGSKNRSKLSTVVNAQQELDKYLQEKATTSKADRLKELKKLLKSGEISQGEYDKARANILSD